MATASGTSTKDVLAFRRTLVDEGVVEELLRTLVALGDTPSAQGEPIEFLKNHFGQGVVPPLVMPRAGPSIQTSYEIVEENRRLKERVAELRKGIKDTRAELRATLPEGTLTVFGVKAYDIPDSDVVGGGSDPFVRVSLLDVPLTSLEGVSEEEAEGLDLGRDMDPQAFAIFMDKHGLSAQTTVKGNDVNPDWDGEELKIVLPAGTPRPPRLLVRVWDDDQTKCDDPLASLEVQLEPNGGKVEKLALKGRGEFPDIVIDFEYKMEDCAAREAVEVA